MDDITKLPKRAAVWVETLKTGMWTVPLGMVVLAIVLYAGAMRIDHVAPGQSMLQSWWLHSGSGDDARNLLSTLLTAIITMSSVVFSITTVALTLAAAQFGSRLVRVYMADTRTKIALGLFAMTTLYCLLALRSVQKDMPPADVPHVTVTLGLVLGVICVLALLFFLHVVARSIVADEVIRRTTAELDKCIDDLPPLGVQSSPASRAWPDPADSRSALLLASADGYIEAIDYERLAALADEHEVFVRLDVRAGQYVCCGGWLGAIFPHQVASPELVHAIRETLLIGPFRTPNQDIEFSIRHVIDIALRALSPSLNDSNTALVVVDHLGGSLSRLMKKSLLDMQRAVVARTPRVFAKGNDHAGVLDAALHQLRQAAAPQPAVIINLLGALGRVGEHVVLPEQHAALVRHVILAASAGLQEAMASADRHDIEAARDAALAKLHRVRARCRAGEVPILLGEASPVDASPDRSRAGQDHQAFAAAIGTRTAHAEPTGKRN